jgi:hypothetical protein
MCHIKALTFIIFCLIGAKFLLKHVSQTLLPGDFHIRMRRCRGRGLVN